MTNAIQISPESTHDQAWGIELLPGQSSNNNTYILYQNIDGHTASALLRPGMAALQGQNIENILANCQLVILAEPENIIALSLRQKNSENILQMQDATIDKRQRQTLQNKLQTLQQKLQKAWADYAAEQFATLHLIQKALSRPLEVYGSEGVVSALYILAEQKNTDIQNNPTHQLGKIFPKLRFHHLHRTTTTRSQEVFPSISGSFAWGGWKFALATELIVQHGAKMVCSKLAIFAQTGEKASFIDLELGRIKFPALKKCTWKSTWSSSQKQANNLAGPKGKKEKMAVFFEYLERGYQWAQNLHAKIREKQVGQLSNFTERQIARFLDLQNLWAKQDGQTPKTLLLCRWQITRFKIAKRKVIPGKTRQATKWPFGSRKLPMLRGQFCWVQPYHFAQTKALNTGWEEIFSTTLELPASEKGLFKPDFFFAPSRRSNRAALATTAMYGCMAARSSIVARIFAGSKRTQKPCKPSAKDFLSCN